MKTFYKVSNYFGGVCEFFDDRNEAFDLFNQLVLDGCRDVEVMEYIVEENGGCVGHSIKMCWNFKVCE